MKNQFNKNIALEDTHSGDVMGGCYGRGKSSGAFVWKGGSWEAYTKGVRFAGFCITGTGSLTGNPQRAKKNLMPNVY